MASLKNLYKPRYADTLKKDQTFSLNRGGRQPMEIIDEPVRTSNLVGEGRHIHLKVRLLHTSTTGVMVLTVTKVVFVHNPED